MLTTQCTCESQRRFSPSTMWVLEVTLGTRRGLESLYPLSYFTSPLCTFTLPALPSIPTSSQVPILRLCLALILLLLCDPLGLTRADAVGTDMKLSTGD